MPDPGHLTERQQQWFASVREGLERQTGKTLAEWSELARACPETAHRKRLAWMKAEFGLGQNHASMVLNAAFPNAAGWSEPEKLATALWADPGARAIHDAVRAAVLALPDTIVGQRRGYTAFSRAYQFAAIKPIKGGVMLGLAVPVVEGLAPTGRNGWSDRLLSQILLHNPGDVTQGIIAHFENAWTRS